EIASAPWNSKHQLLQIGIQGYQVSKAEVPASNIVFLIDTSGSMQDQDKLPLLKLSFRELVKQLRPQDRVSMVVYAGSAGLVLPPTAGNEQEKILAALDQLEAGGSTNGGEGLQLAYAMARQAFIRNGVNRVVLATDGDFNVGTFNQKALETMIADQRKSGIALTTLGFGTGNYNDAMAEQLADLGNGNHAYIDSINEGRKVLVEELSSTMMTIAQDVKIQLEFNPAVVAEYRLIGYENRALRREDFNNDKIDAGEIGAGHDVTALYEITLVGSGGESVDPLRYGRPSSAHAASSEIGWLRLRYKQPGADSSRLIESALTRAQIRKTASPRLRWSAAVAAYADLLRGGNNIGAFGWNQVRALAASAGGDDRWGYRAEFLTLVDRARAVTTGQEPVAVSE
ncbi:MAG: YfbK domain-containing protein, partial [Arenimonas sp.]